MKKNQMKAILLTLACMPAEFLSLPVSAEEPVKNWEYYASMDDYAVYCEYCQMNGIEAADSLPSRKNLPCYDSYVYQGYVLIDDMIVSLGENLFTDEAEQQHRENAAYYGFPENWFRENKSPLRVYTLGGIVSFEFNREAEETQTLKANIINGYRIELTIQNSDFAKEYPIQDIGTVLPCGEMNKLGDVNLNGSIDITDVISINKAILGKETLTEKQNLTADANQNGIVDVSDSLMIMKEIVGITSNFEEN
ncbi:MAG: dockerin type I repeat-containing protein [Oscillospiraceae bacterium]|nr:dockerin type I repeat-containing protein [Oscillospiraceae bacterium]